MICMFGGVRHPGVGGEPRFRLELDGYGKFLAFFTV